MTTGSTGVGAALPAPLMGGGDLDGHEHSVQFFSDDALLLDEVSNAVGSALGAGDAAIVVATQAHGEGVAERLQARGVDLARVRRQGRFVALDAAETLALFMGVAGPDGARFRAVLGGVIAHATEAAMGRPPRVTVYGEMVALLWAAGQHEDAVRLEELWNELAQTHGFALLCAYPMRGFAQPGLDDLLGQICTAHTRVIPEESYRALGTDAERLSAIAVLQHKALALQTEIEARKKAEAALRERNEELRAAVALRGEFLSVAAHELKTPITSLRGFAQLLLRDTRRKREIAPERLEAALAAIDLQSAKLNQLVGRLLDTAQIEAGKLRIEPHPTDLVALVQAAMAQHQGGSSHLFVFAGPDRLDALVDPVRFEQVLTNLLDNAVKFSPRGSSVTVVLEQDAAGSLRLSVTDQGVGVPTEQRADVFERFHQAQAEGHLSGLGLGLHITREIVELHGGAVWLEEPEHRGTRVVVTLPPAAESAQAGSAA